MDLLKKFVPKIIGTLTHDSKLYIVDNASVDGSSEYVKSNYPEAELIRIEVNKGFTNGYQESLKLIDAEYYCLISSDVEVSEGWIEPMLDLFDNHQNIGVIQPKIMSYNQKSHYEYSGAAGAFIDFLGYPFCRGRLFFTTEEDKGQYDDVIDTFWCSGACMFIRKELYHTAGGFDDDFYAHMEDIDLSWQAQLLGYRVVVQPKSVVYHVGGHIITYGSPKKVFRNYRNNLLMLVKNMPSKTLWWLIPFRVSLDGVSGIRALLNGNPRETLAILKAHFSFYAALPHWLRKRKAIQSRIVNHDVKGIYPKSVVLEHFLKGKKKFSDLNWRE